jgi:hypothetical protein
MASHKRKTNGISGGLGKMQFCKIWSFYCVHSRKLVVILVLKILFGLFHFAHAKDGIFTSYLNASDG